ncbi:hypothetical protein [Methanolobus vulcani]|nr:hypothetical protein [Methanolobus vulcani]
MNVTKIILLSLLVILNIILRIPSIPHEKGGGDSFFIHALSNSLSYFGEANWWVNWLSSLGLYPYSYASSVPFALSATTQLFGFVGINSEKAVLIFSLIFGVFSVFTSFIFAGILFKKFLPKFIMAFFFSLSQGIMIFSTWELSARGPFMIFLPLFLFILLKEMPYTKKVPLFAFIFLFMAFTHHYFYFLLPISVIYLVLKIIYGSSQLKAYLKYLDYLFPIILLVAITFPFFTRTLITAGSRYSWIINVVVINLRYIGPIFIFIISGVLYSLLNMKKTFSEYFMLLAFLMLLPFSYSQTYGIYIILCFSIYFISVGFYNLFLVKNPHISHLKLLFIIFLLISFVSFSSFYNHTRTGSSQDYWYMQDSTYQSSVWTNQHISDGLRGFGNSGETWKLLASSDAHPILPTGGAVILAYKLINGTELPVIKISPTSSSYYFDGPYVLEQGNDIWGLFNWLLERVNIDGGNEMAIIDRFNLTYFVEDTHNYEPLVASISSSKDKVYSNGRIQLWLL